ncbi:MAG: outer membrane lipoprotein carrier protein LolA [Crocinitomicaceae bacterium]|nr:outer membrane lipoprotein carrier protein LolA [Crocinitomicaceae bacterium]
MRHLMLFCLFLIPTLVFSQEFKSVSNSSAIKSSIEKKHKETTSIRADFSEKVISDMFKDPQTGYGNFLFKKENKVRWDKTSAQQLILINGDNVKMYEKGKALNNPTSQRVAQQIQGMMISMLSGNFLNEKDFSINYEENSKFYKLNLTPKSPRLSKYMSKIELLFSRTSLLMEEMTMTEKGNQKIIYTFKNVQTNQPIDDSKFTTK